MILNTQKINSRWVGFWEVILFPFLLSRIGVVSILWLAQIFESSPGSGLINGTPLKDRLLIGLVQWDAAWYLSVINYGYMPNGELGTAFSNIVFFPLFPFLVRSFSYLLPPIFMTRNSTIIIGSILSNVLFIMALALLYQFILTLKNDKEAAKRSVWYLIIFPTSFYFSLLYTESTYLFFVIASFRLAQQNKWKWAGFLGGLTALTRPPGVLVLIPLVWMYCQSRKWNIRNIDWKLSWLGLIPIGTSAHFLTQYRLTGNILGPIVAQQAWGRNSIPIWEKLFVEISATSQLYYLTTLNKLFLISFLLLGFYILFRFSAVLGLYTITQLIPQLATGSFDSSIRYCAILFPVFILLGVWGKYSKVNNAIIYIFLILQTILIVGFGQGYWIV